jgi:PAS domain S-box-containing protein
MPSSGCWKTIDCEGNAFMIRRLRLFWPKPTTVGLALIVLILVGNMLVSEWNTTRLFENEHRVGATQKVLTTIEEVLARVTEAETGERGFLITDNSDYLQSYERAVERAFETIAQLTRLTADDSLQQGRITALRQRVDARMEELRNAIAAKQAGGFDAARQSVSTNHGRRLMRDMRDLVTEMQDHEREKLHSRAAESQRSARMTTVTDLVGSMLGIAMVGLAFHLFRRDLANRQRAEDAARRLAAIVECSDDAIISKTFDGTIASWNAGAVRVYGYTADETIGRPVTMLCPPERVDEVAHNLERVCRGERIEHVVTQRVRRYGRRIDVSLSISPIKDADGQVIGASAIARDVTERKTLQREVLAIAADEQRRIGQDLHDGTGQELTGLAMLGQRLASTLAAKDLPEADLASKIVDGLEQALSHVRALSKGLVPVEVDAEGLMAALGDLVGRAGQLYHVRCTFECPRPVRILDNHTATHLYRMSQEALTNALKHGNPTHITVSLKADGDLVTLEIADNGQGLSEARNGTTGMGLRIMNYRAELISAKLEVKPNLPTGTRIVCTLSHRQRSSAESLAEPALA